MRITCASSARRHTSAGRRDATTRLETNTTQPNWYAAVAVTWPERRCALNMAPIFWNTSVGIVVPSPCSFALGQRIFVIRVMMIFNDSPTFRNQSYHSVRLDRRPNNCWAKTVHCMLFIRLRAKSLLLAVEFVGMHRPFNTIWVNFYQLN